MPNWCENKMEVSANDSKGREQLVKFKKLAESEDTDLSLNNLYPMPKKLEGTSSPATVVSEEDYEKEVTKAKEMEKFGCGLPITAKMQKGFIKQYGADNWYDWHVENWGTKWDVEAELVCEYEGSSLKYQFLSAWSPPIKWLEKVSKDFPKLKFIVKYEEEGMGFMGRVIVQNGKVDDKWVD